MRGQTLPAIGFLSTRSAADSKRVMAAFGEGLKEAGFTDGGNVVIDYRFAEASSTVCQNSPASLFESR